MNKEYKIKLDLNKKLYNKKMAFNQFDENVNDFYIEVTKNNKVVKDLDKSIITLVAIKPNNAVDAQFIEVKEGQIYADLKPSMCDLVGNYQAKAMIVLEGEIVTTDTINYSVNEDKIISKLNDDVVNDERFALFTDALARLSDIEASEERRIVNEAERILSEENRKIEEAKRVEAELIRQHEEADRAKYDATRESNENIRKQNESIRLANETNRIDEETKRVEEENKRKLAEEERNANYNLMTEDEERRRSEANAHKEAENLRVQAETNRVNEEAKRRTTEQARVSAENTRVNNENTREANEVVRKNNETKRVEAETQRQNRYNSFIADAEANANNFENYTNTAKVNEEERKSNELDRKSQEARRVSNEVERISNENTRKANEKAREKNETSRQNIFENKVNEVDEKIIEINATKDNFVSSINTKVDTKISELNTTKDNFVSSVNTKVDNKISEIDKSKSDMTNTVTNKIDEVENRFNALTSKQQQDAEVIDARDGETSLKVRLDRDIEKAKQVYVNVEGSHISTDSSVGYAKDVEILGNTIQNEEDLADIRSVGEKVEGQELYEIPVLSRGKNLFSGYKDNYAVNSLGEFEYNDKFFCTDLIDIRNLNNYVVKDSHKIENAYFYNHNKSFITKEYWNTTPNSPSYVTNNNNYGYVAFRFVKSNNVGYDLINNTTQIEEGTQATPYEPYQEDKITILSPVQLEKVGDVRDRIIEKDGVWGVEKNIGNKSINGSMIKSAAWKEFTDTVGCLFVYSDERETIKDTVFSVVSNGFSSVTYNTLFNSDVEGISGYVNNQYGFVVRVLKTRLNGLTTIEYFNQNPLEVKYQTTRPQFIPLPHSQQIKLRTFANKTNISFLTEIEGTIKAQVPKSLGATVNTHTEQISNLNKELDRVKKLEESTVSTVTTESDFTAVEATSGGYFEDVKLEGKTLVNIYPKTTPSLSVSDRDNPKYNVTKKEGYIKVTGSDLEATNYRYVSMGRINFEMFKPNTTYTIVFTKFRGSSKITIQNGDSRHPIVKGGAIRSQDNKLLYTFVTTETLVKSEQILYLFIDAKSTTIDVEAENPMIFEGDLTANPPSGYIEGLKSVGQSATTSEDGVDEIVVSSVKGDGNLFSSDFWESGFISDSTGSYSDDIACVRTKKIRVLPNTLYTFKGYTRRIYYYDITGNFISKLDIGGGTFLEQTNSFTTPSNCAYITLRYDLKASSSIITSLYMMKQYDTIICKNTLKDGLIHQSDKKRLLYYNNETQTWEKPILRQWDSIEKHANGKYYYHKRSGEVVLHNHNRFVVRESTKLNTLVVGVQDVVTTRGVNKNLFCNRFNWVNNELYTEDNECILAMNSGEIRIYVSKSKLSTQDVEGFKAWLQANPTTVVYQLAQEKVYECTNIDLITYANETNFIVESGVLSPKTTLKVHNNISNVVSLLQKKVSLLESNITSYMITQNRLMLASRYNADTVSFKVDVASFSDTFEYDNDLYELILNNILVGKDNYNREYIENLIIFYWMDFIISDEMYSTLFEIIEEQHNPKIEEETPLI